MKNNIIILTTICSLLNFGTIKAAEFVDGDLVPDHYKLLVKSRDPQVSGSFKTAALEGLQTMAANLTGECLSLPDQVEFKKSLCDTKQFISKYLETENKLTQAVSNSDLIAPLGLAPIFIRSGLWLWGAFSDAKIQTSLTQLLLERLLLAHLVQSSLEDLEPIFTKWDHGPEHIYSTTTVPAFSAYLTGTTLIEQAYGFVKNNNCDRNNTLCLKQLNSLRSDIFNIVDSNSKLVSSTLTSLHRQLNGSSNSSLSSSDEEFRTLLKNDETYLYIVNNLKKSNGSATFTQTASKLISNLVNQHNLPIDFSDSKKLEILTSIITAQETSRTIRTINNIKLWAPSKAAQAFNSDYRLQFIDIADQEIKDAMRHISDFYEDNEKNHKE